jgi:uncharacterized protein YbjQ (UPF0145 family)
VSPRTDDAAQEYEQRSWRELEAGHLPLRAQERLASMAADHAFTSDLTTAEHHAVRSVGFVPVGQVLGASVYQIGWRGGWDCGVRYAGYGQRAGGFNAGGFSGMGMSGYPVGGPGSAYSVSSVDVSPWRATLRQAQQRAMSRLEQEARALGGDGVVAVRFSERQVASGVVEFHVIGTAVRAAAGPHPTRLFTCDLSGQDFGRLLQSGFVPTALLFGVAVMTRHDDWATRMNNRSWANVELAGYTQLVTDTRAEARRALAREAAAARSEIAVMSTHEDRISESECALVEGGRDHLVRTTFLGTGVAQLPRRNRSAVPAPLPILRLRDRPQTDIERTRTRTERTIRG